MKFDAKFAEACFLSFFITESQCYYLFSAVLCKISPKSNAPSMIESIGMIFPLIFDISILISSFVEIFASVSSTCLGWNVLKSLLFRYIRFFSPSLTARDIEIDFAMLWTTIATQY